MDRDLLHLLWVRFLFLGLTLLFLCLHLLPHNASSRYLIAPDILTILTFAWMIRRPDAITPLLIALCVLLADFLLQRPPGLWALLTILGMLFLRSRLHEMGRTGFWLEWLLVVLTIAVMILLNHAMFNITLLVAPDITLTLIQYILTILTYPIFVLITTYGFRISPKGFAEQRSGLLR